MAASIAHFAQACALDKKANLGMMKKPRRCMMSSP
jgi:hypothetical protein